MVGPDPAKMFGSRFATLACSQLHGPDEGGRVAGDGHRPRHPPGEHEHREPEPRSFLH